MNTCTAYAVISTASLSISIMVKKWSLEALWCANTTLSSMLIISVSEFQGHLAVKTLTKWKVNMPWLLPVKDMASIQPAFKIQSARMLNTRMSRRVLLVKLQSPTLSLRKMTHTCIMIQAWNLCRRDMSLTKALRPPMKMKIQLNKLY